MTFDSSEAIARRWANGSGTRIYAIDGRSGAGKSTLARKIREQIKAANPSVRVILIEVENHIPGWNGLVDGVQNIADDILEPFLANGYFSARGWNWYTSRWNPPRRHPARGRAEILLLVGCGSTSLACAPYLRESVWIEAPKAVRRARVTAREGDPGEWWELWARQEEALLAQRNSPAQADFVLPSAELATAQDAEHIHNRN